MGGHPMLGDIVLPIGADLDLNELGRRRGDGEGGRRRRSQCWLLVVLVLLLLLTCP